MHLKKFKNLGFSTKQWMEERVEIVDGFVDVCFGILKMRDPADSFLLKPTWIVVVQNRWSITQHTNTRSFSDPSDLSRSPRCTKGTDPKLGRLLACLCLILMNWKSSERENMISFQTAVQMFTSRTELRGNRFSLAFFVSLNVCLVLLIMLFNYRCLWEKQIKGKWWTIIDRLLIIVSQSYPRRRRRNIINGRYRIIGPIQIWIQPKWTRISLLASWHKLFDAFSWPFKLSTF